MVIFIYGPDTFRSNRKISEIIKEYRSKYKSGLNFVQIELTEDRFSELQDAIETSSMFNEKKLIIIKNAFSASKELKKRISDYLSRKDLFENKDIILIFFEKGAIKNKNVLFKLLVKKSFKKQEFKQLPPHRVKLLIKEEVEELGGRIHPVALERLLLYYGNDLWQLTNELKKLVSFKKNETIQAEDVENLCETSIDLNIFKTIEAISDKNKKRALKLISKHFQVGENESKVFSMIVYQFRTLIKVKSILEENRSDRISMSSRERFRKSGVHPFVIRKTIPIARNFSMEELKKIYQKLFNLDLKIKTGRIEPRLGIDMFITGL